MNSNLNSDFFISKSSNLRKAFISFGGVKTELGWC